MPDAIAAPEAANNANVPASLVPLLAFGIPGSTSAAIMLGALVMHGVRPGPQLLTGKPEIVYALFGGLLTATGGHVRAWPALHPTVDLHRQRAEDLPDHVILVVVVVGMLGLNLGVFQVYVVLIVGVVGFLMQRYGFNTVATVLGLVLGALIEQNFRRVPRHVAGQPRHLHDAADHPTLARAGARLDRLSAGLGGSAGAPPQEDRALIAPPAWA